MRRGRTRKRPIWFLVSNNWEEGTASIELVEYKRSVAQKAKEQVKVAIDSAGDKTAGGECS